MNNDENLKYFWLSIRNIINKYSSNYKYIEKFNKTVIDLDKRKEYGEIKIMIDKFMNDNIENIIESVLLKMDFVDIHYLDRQISVWKSTNRDYKCNSINYNFLHLLNNISSQTQALYEEILKIYVKYLSSNSDNIYLYDIINLAIKNNKSSILHIFRNEIDIKRFIKKDCKKDIQSLQKMKTNKLINYLQYVDYKFCCNS